MKKENTNTRKQSSNDMPKTYGWLAGNPDSRKRNAPLLIGKIEINEEQLTYLWEKLQHEKKAVLHCAAWEQTYSSGGEYLKLTITLPYKPQGTE